MLSTPSWLMAARYARQPVLLVDTALDLPLPCASCPCLVEHSARRVQPIDPRLWAIGFNTSSRATSSVVCTSRRGTCEWTLSGSFLRGPRLLFACETGCAHSMQIAAIWFVVTQLLR